MRGLIWGTLFVITSIILGAMLSHMLKSKVSVKDLETLTIAAKYLFYMGLPLIILALTNHDWQWPNLIFNLFIASGVCFSGSLIGYVITKYHWLVFITPVGGMLMVISWVAFLTISIKKLSKKTKSH